jgi:glutamine synthetase
MPDPLSGWDIHDTPYFKELSISNRANGYQDIVAKIDLSTYRRLPWENNVPFFLISFSHPEDGKPLIACARSILNEVVGRFEEGEQKLECLAGAEFEVSSVSLEPAAWDQEANSPVYSSILQYFQFSETAHSVVEKGHVNLNALTPGSKSICSSAIPV